MKRILTGIAVLGIVLPMLLSCKAISSLVNSDDKVVAKVGKHRLTQSEVMEYIPEGVSGEDSVRAVMQYINSWASDIVFIDIAESQLSKAEKDVTKELEEYRNALLKYRYEQRYINERLDTSISMSEITAYYESHKNDFIAEVPIVKARFMRISADSPNLELIRKKMSSDNIDDLILADSLAYSSADKYTDYGMRWIDMVELARDFGTDYGSLLSGMDRSYIQTRDEYGKLNIAYITDFIKAGDTQPIEYCLGGIKDILIGIRKHRLATVLEQDLLDDAREKGKFIIY